MSTDEFVAAIEEHVRAAAAQVSRRYRTHTTYADLAQEGFVWALQHKGTVASRLEDGKRGEYRLVAPLAGHMQRVARQEKATRAGYSPDDEYFYSRGTLELILPAVWDERHMLKRPTSGEDDPSLVGRSKADPAQGNDWLAQVIDVRAAWGKANLTADQRDALALRYRDKLSVDAVAAQMGVAQSTASDRLNGALRGLIEALGGQRPEGCTPDCECRPQTVGSRRVISNATAQAITSQGYEE
jgi:DNA-directed RNA polymerase specialized sigma24 family protein